MLRWCGIQCGEKCFRRIIFDKLLERMEFCINNHGDYFEHLIKFELSLYLYMFLFFKLQNFWSDLSTCINHFLVLEKKKNLLEQLLEYFRWYCIQNGKDEILTNKMVV